MKKEGEAMAEQKKTILIADDEVRMRRILCDYLSIKGYDVVEAADGVEAMEQLEEFDKDCFFDWCARYGHDIGTEDAHLLVAHYIELFGNAACIDDEPFPDSGDDNLPYYPGISDNYFDTGIPHFEVFDDNYD